MVQMDSVLDRIMPAPSGLEAARARADGGGGC